PVGDHHVYPAGQYLFGLHVADELDLAVATPEPSRRLAHPLVALALLLTVAEQGNRGVGPAEHFLRVDGAHLSKLHEELGAGIDVGAQSEEVGRLGSRGRDGAEGWTVDASNPALYEERGRHDGSGIACRHPGRRFTVLAQACADAHRRVRLGADRLCGVVVHVDHLAGWDEAQARMGVEQALDGVRLADHDDLDTEVLHRLRGADHHLFGSEVTPHAVDRDAKSRRVQMSRFRTALACAVMNFLRGSTSLPISFSKTSLTAAASSISTCSRVRVAGFMVVSQSWSAFISPRPLKRLTSTFPPIRLSSLSRSSSL